MPEFRDSMEMRARELQRLLELARSAKRTHESIAATMERLAEAGHPEDLMRRRALADRARSFAEMEARHIAKLEAYQLGAPESRAGPDDDDPDRQPRDTSAAGPHSPGAP